MCYGGNLTIEKFRESFNKIHFKEHGIIKIPNMESIGILYEKQLNTQKKLYNSLEYKLNTNKIFCILYMFLLLIKITFTDFFFFLNFCFCLRLLEERVHGHYGQHENLRPPPPWRHTFSNVLCLY